MRSTQRVAVAVAVFVVVAVTPVAAQDEAALKSFFEGRRVTVRVDMPGSSDGINIRNGAIDLQDYRNNLRQYGTSIRAGDSVVVTLVKFKKDLIEFQLAGGGYGTFWDDTSTSPDIPYVEKSERERELEKQLRDEQDDRERRRIRSELDELQDRRERENHRIRDERERQSEIKAVQLAERRQQGGSRFNLRFDSTVPRDITPDQVMATLVEWIDFGMSARVTDVREELPPPPDITALRKGMTRSEVEQMLGRPAQVSQRHEGSVAITTLVYVTGDQQVSADFVEDVLVKYTITSK